MCNEIFAIHFDLFCFRIAERNRHLFETLFKLKNQSPGGFNREKRRTKDLMTLRVSLKGGCHEIFNLYLF